VPSQDPTITCQLEQFGANLRRERDSRKITQEALAVAAGLNIRTVQKIEAGQTNILLTTVLRLQNAIGCKWESLMPPV
jgi:transcriptional regulator with XRE-family HTH domain